MDRILDMLVIYNKIVRAKTEILEIKKVLAREIERAENEEIRAIIEVWRRR